MRLKQLLLYWVSIVLCSCGAGSNDRAEKLTGGYSYLGEGGNRRIIFRHSMNKNATIYSAVTDFVFDDDFILIEQHPQYKSHVISLADDIWDHQGDIAIYEKRADSMLRYDKKYSKIFEHDVNYWIVVVKQDTLLGPLTIQEYKTFKRQFAVPKYLNLKVER